MLIREVISGFLKLDGGGMFGVVPKSMWHKLNPADENNMTLWSMRSLLIETENHKILVDTGIGNKQSARFQSHFSPHGPSSIESLQSLMIQPEEITDVFITHLHFDHVGGAVSLDDQAKYIPTFPNATYWTNQLHYNWAHERNPREAASFLHENFVPLKEKSLLKFIDVQKDDLEWLPGIKVRTLYGHTEGMMMLLIDHPNGNKYAYPSDLIPSRWHVRLPYVMSYDLQPMKTIDERSKLLTDCIDENRIIIFEHDPSLIAAAIHKDEKGRFGFKAQDF